MTRDGVADLVMRPHPLFILVHPLGHLAWILGLCLMAAIAARLWTWTGLGAGPAMSTVWGVGALLALARLVWAAAQWAARRYGLTGDLVWAESGVLNRRRDELRTDRVQSVTLDRPLVPRLLGLGSIGFATAGTGGYEVVWYLIGAPGHRLEAARSALGCRKDGL